MFCVREYTESRTRSSPSSLRTGGRSPGLQRGQSAHADVLSTCLNPSPIFHLRFRPSRSDELVFILGCELVQTFRRPSQDIHRFALASYMVELTDVMVAGREAGQEIYTLLLHGLVSLEESSPLPALFLPAFELRLLVEVGLCPKPEFLLRLWHLPPTARDGRGRRSSSLRVSAACCVLSAIRGEAQRFALLLKRSTCSRPGSRVSTCPTRALMANRHGFTRKRARLCHVFWLNICPDLSNPSPFLSESMFRPYPLSLAPPLALMTRRVGHKAARLTKTRPPPVMTDRIMVRQTS